MRIKEINIFTPSEDRGYLGCFLTLSDCMAEYPRPRRGYQFANLETRSIWVYDGVSWWNSNRQLEPMRVIGSPAQSGDIVNNEPSAYYYVDNSGLEQTLEFVFNNTTTGMNESITVRSSGYAMVYIWWTGKTLEYKKIDIPSDERMSHLVRGTIDIGSYQYNVLDEYNSQEKKGLYVIKTSLGFGGHMLVTGDDMGHVIHQFIFSDYYLDDSGTINRHRDDTPSVIVRTYNLRSSEIEETIPVGTWGKWRYLQDTFISQTFGNAANKTVSQKIISEAITAINNSLSNALAIISASVTTKDNINGCLLFDGTKDSVDYVEEATTSAVSAVYYVRSINKFVALSTDGDLYSDWEASGSYREQGAYNKNNEPNVSEVFYIEDGTKYYYVNGGLERLHTQIPYTNNSKVNLVVNEIYLDDNENRPYISRLFKNRYENGKYITQVTICQLDGTIDCQYYVASDSPNKPKPIIKLDRMDGGKTGYAVIDWERVNDDFWINNDNSLAIISDIANYPGAEYFSPTIYSYLLSEKVSSNRNYVDSHFVYWCELYITHFANYGEFENFLRTAQMSTDFPTLLLGKLDDGSGVCVFLGEMIDGIFVESRTVYEVNYFLFRSITDNNVGITDGDGNAIQEGKLYCFETSLPDDAHKYLFFCDINPLYKETNLLQLSVNIEPDSMGDGTFNTNSAYNKLVFRCEGYVDNIRQCELRFMRRLKRRNAKTERNTRHGWGVVRDGYSGELMYPQPLDTLERTVFEHYADELTMGTQRENADGEYVTYRTGYSKGSKRKVYLNEAYRVDINNYGMAVFQGDKMISNVAEFGITIINKYSEAEQQYMTTVYFTLGRGGAKNNIRNKIEFPI